MSATLTESPPQSSTGGGAPGDTPGASLGGKYLTFVVGEETYGIGILSVREIIGYVGITPLPQTPDYVKGVINLRGKVIPVVDLRVKFGFSEREPDDETCIIVAQVAAEDGSVMDVGVLVDAVDEVKVIAEADIEPPPSLGTSVDTRFILGIGKAADKVIILLDIDNALSSDEKAVLQEVA